VEYIVDSDRNFYFLEMNTRLQVEHPVTEYVTGIDLVEQMIRVAAGETLSIRQDDVSLDGWAMETRIYAEDPFRDFLPSTGRLVRYREPPASDTVRVDSGVGEGGEISIHYDPMIAKLVTKGATRADAITAMRGALDAYYIRGVQHNIPFLAAIMAHPRFNEGRLSTGFIQEEFTGGFTDAHLAPADPQLLAAVAATIHCRQEDRAANAPGGARKLVAVVKDGADYALTADAAGAVDIGGEVFAVNTDWRPGQTMFHGHVNDAPVCIQIDRTGSRLRLSHQGTASEFLMLRPAIAELNRLMPEKIPPDTSNFLLSPMPGLLLSISVGPGDTVKSGQPLAIVEAMKMENLLRAERDGVIKELLANEGDSLTVDQPILEFE
jgi:propionyl-CoA carboxylase alpha chain